MKRAISAAEVSNDPSLRWVDYRRGEVVWSDVHRAEVRFDELVGNDQAFVMTLNGMDRLPNPVGLLSIRRASVMNQ